MQYYGNILGNRGRSDLKEEGNMKKPEKEVRTGYDIDKVLDYIKEKYGRDPRDYYNKKNDFNTWRVKIAHEPTFEFDLSGDKPNPWRIWNNFGRKMPCTEQEYKWQIEKNHDQYCRFNAYEAAGHAVPNSNFWDWVLDEVNWCQVGGRLYGTLYVKELMEKLSPKEWQYKILSLLHSEFGEDEMDFYIESRSY